MPPPLADVVGASVHAALVLCGLALALGFLSPLCSVVVALSHALVVVRAIVGATSPDVFGPACVGVAAALTIAAVGPGAFSVDARLFGRHRIVIRSRRDRA